MKKTALYATAGSALALALLATSLPASADVEVFASITKTKDIHITENITITKIVNLHVEALNLHYGAAAEADAILNQENTENFVDRTADQLTPTPEEELDNFGIELKAAINTSINRNQGIVDVNQDVGNMANQGNQVALAIATPASGAADPQLRNVFVNSQSEAEQINQANSVTELEDPFAEPEVSLIDPPNKSADITGSINGNTGIVNVNQNAGNMNNQANSEAIAVAINLAGVALSEAALGQVNGNFDESSERQNRVREAGVEKTASMTSSLNGNLGVGGVNQAAGNNGNQANIFSLSFIDGGGAVGIRPVQ